MVKMTFGANRVYKALTLYQSRDTAWPCPVLRGKVGSCFLILINTMLI